MKLDTQNHEAEGATISGAQADQALHDIRPVRSPPRFESRVAPTRSSSAIERWLLRRVLVACGNPAIRIVLWDGEAIQSSRELPVGDIIVRDPATLRHLLADPDVAVGDAYSAGTIEIRGPLVDVLSAICMAAGRTSSSGLLGRILNRPRRRRSHSLAASRDSVNHHYDLGNDFYKLWLDERMQYTCAYYAEPGFTLETAQIAKLDHICRKLQLKAGQSVIEAGCGWGGLALHMAERYGVSVRAFNLSHEQIAYARERARSTGIAGRIEFVEDDYR